MTPLDLLTDLEDRQEELILRLEELDQRIQKTLAECQVSRVSPHNYVSTAEPR